MAKFYARATINDKTTVVWKGDDPSLGWEELIDVHDGRLRKAGKGADRALRRMETRSQAAAEGHEKGTGIVEATDPLDARQSVTYSVQDW